MHNIVRIFRNLLAAVSLVVVSFGSALSPDIAQARNVWPARGAAGDQGAQTECPNGQVAVGFNGRAGAWIDAIQLICARPLDNGGYEGAQPTGGLYGGTGGGPTNQICDPGTLILDAKIILTDDAKKVRNFQFHCVDRTGNGMNSHGFGNEDATFGSMGPTVHQGCSGESLTGLNLRFGQHVNAVGLICDQVALATAAAPPPPVKAIKNVRRSPPPASASASGPSLALRASISGPWMLVANGSEHYNLLLTAQGDGLMLGQDNLPFPVGGSLVSADGSPNMQGTFSANMLPTRQLQGGYGQKNGTSGQCLLNYSGDGQILAGDCSRGNESVRWSATRGSWPAEAAAAPRLDRGALHRVEVKMPVDVYAAPGGNGASIGQLGAGTADVELVQACQDNWCHVRWLGHEGWVYSGPDYNALDQ